MPPIKHVQELQIEEELGQKVWGSARRLRRSLLEGPETDTEQFGSLFAMAGDFREGPANYFFFDFFQGSSEGDDHGSNIFFAGLNLLRQMLRLDHILPYGHDQSFEEVAELPDIFLPGKQM
jgi:hypothetical protein